MRHSTRQSILVALLSVTPAPAIAQGLTALRVGAAEVKQTSESARFVAPLRVAESSNAISRWPFVLGGALIGGVAAGVWYAHQVAKVDDPMIDLSMPVVGIGIGLGAFAGLIVSEVVRGAHSSAPGN